MQFLDWLSKTATALLALYYKYRGKAYSRMAMRLVLIGGGVLALQTIAAFFLQQALKEYLGAAAEAPWWFGGALIAAGVILYVGFAIFDPEVFRPTKNEGAIAMSIPPNWTFEQTARVIGQITQQPVDLNALGPGERGAILTPHHLRAPNAIGALLQLRALAPAGVVRAYDVIEENNQLILRF